MPLSNGKRKSGARQSRQGLSLLARVWRNLVWLRRATGFRIIDYVVTRLSPRQVHEEAKEVLLRSFWIALSRCAVHVIPIGSFILLLVLNYYEVFLGATFSANQTENATWPILFQIAAKGQEMLCVASLATIILQMVHYDLLLGDGTPYGFITSHLWFMGPHSLLQPEYLSPAGERSLAALKMIFTRQRHSTESAGKAFKEQWYRLRLVLLLPVFVVLASLIGPVTAILLIPRELPFAAGRTDFFMTATPEEMWPSVVDTKFEHEACAWPNATLYPICPSGGYNSIRGQVSSTTFSTGSAFDPSHKADDSVSGWTFPVQDQAGIMSAMLSNIHGDRTCQPMAYAATTLQILTRDWYSAAHDRLESTEGFLKYIQNYKYAAQVTAACASFFPLSVVQCSPAQNLSQTSEVVHFRNMSREAESVTPNSWGNYNDTLPVNISGLRRAATSRLRIQWILLDPDLFGPVTVGVLFELPWSQHSNSRVVLGCSVTAAWVAGTLKKLSTNDDAWFADSSETLGKNLSKSVEPSDPSAKNVARHIDVDMAWLNLLTPAAPDVPSTNDDWRPSTLENIFVTAGFDTLLQDLRSRPHFLALRPGDCRFQYFNASLTDTELYSFALCDGLTERRKETIENTIARVMSDGLSRRLSWRAFNTTPPLREWFTDKIDRAHPGPYGRRLLERGSKVNAVNLTGEHSVPNQIVHHVEWTVEGLGWRLYSTADYLSTVVALVYLLFSVGHCVRTLWHHVTSSCWDTAGELMLLAFNSKPNPHLHGTSAGIDRARTFKRVMKVRALTRKDRDGETENHDY